MTKWAVKKKKSRQDQIAALLWSVSGRMSVGLRKGSECWVAPWAGCSLRKRDGSAVTQPLDQGPHQPAPWRGEQDRLGENTSRQIHSGKAGPGKAGKSIHESGTGSGLVRITRVRARPVIAGQLCTDKTGLKKSWEMVQTTRIRTRHGCDGERERPALPLHRWGRDWWHWAELKQGPVSWEGGTGTPQRGGQGQKGLLVLLEPWHWILVVGMFFTSYLISVWWLSAYDIEMIPYLTRIQKLHTCWFCFRWTDIAHFNGIISASTCWPVINSYHPFDHNIWFLSSQFYPLFPGK